MHIRTHQWARHAAAISSLGLIVFMGSVGSPALAAKKNVCAMLSTSALRSWWGEDLHVDSPAMDIPQSDSCHWIAAPGKTGSLMVQIVPPRYYPESESKHLNGFKRLSGIGEKAFVAPRLGGWTAAALKGTKVVTVWTNGGKTNSGTAVSIVKTLVQQL